MPPDGTSRSPHHASAALIAALLAFVPAAELRSQEVDDPSPHSDAELVAEVISVAPGRPFTVALRLTMDEGWHSYWRNPGDAGGTTTIEWTLPAGFTAGDIQWPYPRRVEAPPLVSYGYDDEVLLLVDVTPPHDLGVEAVALAARADWVVCEEICLPATAQLELKLTVAEGPTEYDPRWSQAIEATRKQMPVVAPGWEFRAWREAAGFVLEATAPESLEEYGDGAYFFSAQAGTIAHAAPQPATTDARSMRLSLAASEFLHGPVTSLEGVLLAPPGTSWPTAEGRRALAVEAPVTIGPAVAGTPITLITALLFALIGGIILNLMPCVFPVLSIKVLGFVEQGGASRAAVRIHGAAFAAGVIASFLALGVALLVIRASGTLVGWGFQLQSPAVVGLLAVLFFVLGLSLLGVFDVGTSLTRLGGLLGSSGGLGASFGSGVLATVVATPCIAPLMGAALGFALTQPPFPTLLIFSAIGVGMALPYAVLSMWPTLLARLPRPGAWMETFRQLLAFPLFATALWLVWVFGQQTGIDGAAYLLAALLLVALGAWMLWHWPRATASGRSYALSRTGAAILIVAALAVGLRGTRSHAGPPTDELWQPFSAVRVVELQANGRPVFIDFTAAWCLTCKVNERVVLEAAKIEEAFRQRDVVLLKADWTRQDPEITRALEAFGRTGVPLYVLYTGATNAPPIILPTILTKETLLAALGEI